MKENHVSEQRQSFDRAAVEYDQSRPSYPEEVIDWIIGKTKMPKDKPLLEIGPGTGQATMKFAQRGYAIRCIEIGENLAKLLREKGKGHDITVDVSSFEEWTPKSPFKTHLVFCATAFHWIDPDIRYKKCHDLLEDNGYLVLLWNIALPTNIPEEQRAYQLLWEHYPQRDKSDGSKIDIKEVRKQDILASGLFELEYYLDYTWKLRQSKENLKKGFCSQSSYLALEEKDRRTLDNQIDKLFSGLKDTVEVDFCTTVYIAKRK